MKERFGTALLDHPAVRVLEEARKGTGPAWLVGGALRDAALGLRPKDLDFACAEPFALATEAADRLKSRVVALGKEASPTYRVPLGEGLLDFTGLQGSTLEEDLLRRDFTVNALGMDLSTGEVYDPAGGLSDLRRKVIRMTSEEALERDPVRVLRAFRFLARLPGFHLDSATERALPAHAQGLLDAPAERLQAEIDKLFRGSAAGRAVRAMKGSGVLFLLFPELRPLEGLGQNAHHHADALEHTLQTLEALDGDPPWLAALGLPPFAEQDLLLLRLAALFHDAGKAATRTVDEEGRVHFYGHPKPSADSALEALKRLRFSHASAEKVSFLCLNHLRPLALTRTEPRQTAVRRLVHSAGDLLPHLLALSYADKTAARGLDQARNLTALEVLAREVMEVARREGGALREIPKLVNGLEALEILGLSRPGPELGRALDALLERQVEGAVSTREQAVAFLARWAREHLRPTPRR